MSITMKLPPDTTICLASASPRRRELLDQIGLTYTCVPSQADETMEAGISPSLAVQKLSFLKAADVAKERDNSALIIGADTVVVFNGAILTKPKDKEDAKQMLQALSGACHSVLTGLTVIRRKDAKSISITEETKVYFKSLTEKEIDSYIQTNECMDKAGSYGIQGLGGLFVERIEGDYYNVVGLPIMRLGQLLQQEFDIEIMWEVK